MVTGNECQDRELPPLTPDLSGLTPFGRKVSLAAMRIPGGRVATYGALARAAGKPEAARAVGRVMATNPLPVLVPCHRVVKSNFDIGEYGSGREVKKRLLRTEGVKIRGEKVDRAHVLDVVG